MFSCTITTPTQTLTVSAATRRTTILEAAIHRTLFTALPDLAGAPYLIDEASLRALREERPQAVALLVALGDFAAVAAHITGATGTLCTVADGQFSTADWLALFGAFLDEPVHAADGLWAQVTAAVNALAAPVTPADVAPPAALTEADKANPLS